MPDFKVDTNSMRPDETILASRRREPAPVAVGETVRVTDIADGKRYSAVVKSVSDKAVELKIDLTTEMLPLDAIDSLANSYFKDVRMPRLVTGAQSTGSARAPMKPRQLLQG